MAKIKAFKALRFTEKAGDIKDLVCPPYDIISDQGRKAYLSQNPYNVIRLELPTEGSDIYAGAGEALKNWISSDILKKDSEDSLYIYEEEFSLDGANYSFKGIICRVQLEEFSKGIVLPHEETLSKAKDDRFSLMSATNCNFSQVYSLYTDEDGQTSSKINEYSKCKPDIEFTDSEGVTQRLWIITDVEKIASITNDFNSRKVYIADGHHRYETALNYRDHLRETGKAEVGAESDDVMMMLVDMQNPGLVVFPTHRIVQNLDGFDGAKLMRDCLDMFHVKQLGSRESVLAELSSLYLQSEKAIGYFDKNIGWHLLTLKDKQATREIFSDKSKALTLLDVTILHSLVLEKHMGIGLKDLANQSNLIYTRSDKEAEDAALDYADCCFLLNPTRVDEIASVAAAGEKMPQKSTYFYPKLITGLVMNSF